MSDALSIVWIEDAKPETGSICWRDNIFFVDATASASSVGCDGKLIAYHRADKVQALVDALEHIADGHPKDYSDNYSLARAVLAQFRETGQ